MIYPTPADDHHTRDESLRLLDRTRPDGVSISLADTVPGSKWHHNAGAYGWELSPTRFVRHITNGRWERQVPLRLWRCQRYLGQVRSLVRARDERAQFIREIEQLGLSTGIDATTALIARISGYEHQEWDFDALFRRRLFTGDVAGLACAVSRFNEQVSAPGRSDILGHVYLAAVGN